MITGITEPAWDTWDLIFKILKYLPAKGKSLGISGADTLQQLWDRLSRANGLGNLILHLIASINLL